MNCFSLGPFGSLLAGRGRARLKCRFLGSVCFLMWPRTLHLNQLSSNSDIYPGLTLCFRIRGELSRDHLVKKRTKNMPQERLSRLLFLGINCYSFLWRNINVFNFKVLPQTPKMVFENMLYMVYALYYHSIIQKILNSETSCLKVRPI